VTHMTVERERTSFAAPENDVFAATALLGRDLALLEYELPARYPDRAYLKHCRGRHLSPTARLRNAIEHHELSLDYQPQYEIAGGHNCGVEALARWLLPNGESISPTVFIPRAEQSGLIGALGAWVLQEACTTVAAWNRDSDLLPILCVNVSPRQISRAFCTLLESTLEETGFPAAQLELEITEGILIEQPELALDCLARWKLVGARISLDDFGAGYSSLNYLSRLPVDRIKIDKSLIHRMTDDPKTAAIVRAVVSLGADLGCAVLAEGVETEMQLTMLFGMGCQQVQGYLLARPACADEARALLAMNWGKRPKPTPFPAACSATARSNAF
jgi:EAL domain-containing protein (putative c-di-GMP-specific phosphodiesterase class I)